MLTKSKAITYKDLVYYFHSYEIVFLYAKKNMDSHVMIGLFSNRTDQGIVSSELPPNNAVGVKVLAFTSKKLDSGVKSLILFSLK